ncbi:phosphatidylcholine transfer protein-like isoform X2 [Benincasa hispida]|uniref:phosphatidylcholine transfer protein-like isoform X2 n=1 Tax=Benincasa hispida TaxID=102211 RepID=UPI0018FF9C01|nr:phosphatidylcholine transfer protein-like isoform X2 [Benincasa hispida]
MVGVFQFQATSEDLWRGSIYGSWGTVLVLVFIAICHLVYSKKNVCSLLSRLKTSSIVADRHISDVSPSSECPPPQLRVMEAISDTDLKSLLDNLDGRIINENEKWERVVEKSNDHLSYSAKCCKPKDGPLKYSSVTIFENCCPILLRDFYMDNDYRKQWDSTMLMHEQLQMDGTSGIEVGRTLKKFPLLTPREYILSWRLWEGKDETFYCFTKECDHPLAPQQKKYVRVTFFRSGWRIRRVSGRNACEISMLHQEDAGLNVEMAKLAFAKGIWSFVCKMDKALRKYALINNPPSSSLVTAVTLIKKMDLRTWMALSLKQTL